MKKALILGVFAAAAVLVSACGANTDCHAGDSCACDLAGVCTWNCVDEGCAFTAGGAGEANLSCDSGGCTLAASGAGDVTFDCAGGGCTVTATGQGNVNLSCAGGGCSVDCGGMGNCTVTECTDCTCDETALTASCS